MLRLDCAAEGDWSFHGAFAGTPEGAYRDGSFDTQDGINLGDTVNFYAPQALGPGNPNTWYFGSDKLYRTTDRADTAIVASQLLEPGVPISAIAISPQDDNVRVVGLNNGRVFATRTGSNALVQIAGPGATNGTNSTPALPVGRIAIDPNNSSVGYLCFSRYGFPGASEQVWKTANLNEAFVEFTPASRGLPGVPVNAIAIDPVTAANGASTDVYVGTDIGVYYSADGGGFWTSPVAPREYLHALQSRTR
ncbi:MAG TPA: hypothetical protein VK993_08880 [Chthoniobacterales bacterium]|nr:hypothetical protein [Chthoniobacterales bacterium]